MKVLEKLWIDEYSRLEKVPNQKHVARRGLLKTQAILKQLPSHPILKNVIRCSVSWGIVLYYLWKKMNTHKKRFSPGCLFFCQRKDAHNKVPNYYFKNIEYDYFEKPSVFWKPRKFANEEQCSTSCTKKQPASQVQVHTIGWPPLISLQHGGDGHIQLRGLVMSSCFSDTALSNCVAPPEAKRKACT